MSVGTRNHLARLYNSLVFLILKWHSQTKLATLAFFYYGEIMKNSYLLVSDSVMVGIVGTTCKQEALVQTTL